MNLLAIDDNSDNLASLRAILSVFLPGASLMTVTSCREGIELARSRRPDVILLDIQMSGIDGFQAAQALKADPLTRHIPIIMLTALRTDSASKVKGLEAGADVFLAKPVDAAELVAQVKAMVRIKRSEEALRRERDNLELQVARRMKEADEQQRMNQLLLDAIPNHACLIGLDRKVLAMNRTAARERLAVGDLCWAGIGGMRAITGDQEKHYMETGTPLEHTRCNFCRAEEALALQKTVQTEIFCNDRFYLVWWIPVDSRLYLHYVVDLTEQKKVEEEKRLLEEKLNHAQRLESIGNLAGGIAHDFNNILTVIGGYANLLQLDFQDNRQALAMVKEISASTDRAAELTRRILAFSRNQNANFRHENLKTILENLRVTLGRLIREDIDLSISLDEKDLPVMADRLQIDQVLVNLVINARDAMPSEGIITVSTSLLVADEADIGAYGIEKSGNYGCITVSDTGKGMDRETLERIFEPYFTTKQEGSGTGLGLSIVYGIIKNHNGAISVTSRPGKGATFRLLLPLATRIDQPLPVERRSLALPGGTGTVMVVEDDPMVRMLVSRLLEFGGYRVMTAENGEEGLALFSASQEEIHLVVSDITMPKMNGGEMCSEIRAACPDIPIILMSGYYDDVFSPEICASQGYELLLKPLDREILLSTVQKLVKSGTH